MWSTRSAASMNDVDTDERRLIVGRRGDGLPSCRWRFAPASGFSAVRRPFACRCCRWPSMPSTLVVAVDPGKVLNRVWVSDGSGLLDEPAVVAGVS